jgi:hypothetical protein
VAYEYGAKEPEKLKIKDMTPKAEGTVDRKRHILYVAMACTYMHFQMAGHIPVVSH